MSKYRIRIIREAGAAPISFVLTSTTTTLAPFLDDVVAGMGALRPPINALPGSLGVVVKLRQLSPCEPGAKLVAKCGIEPGTALSVVLNSPTPVLISAVNANANAHALTPGTGSVAASQINKGKSNNANSGANASVDAADMHVADAVSKGLMFVNFANMNATGYLVVREVPADNNCLFHAVSRATGSRGDDDGTDASSISELMRLQVASYIQSCPELTSLALLGHPSIESYYEWITRSSSWGGEIEVTALSRILGIGIFVIDVRSRRLNRYVPPNDTTECIVLAYTGVHFDYVAFCAGAVTLQPNPRGEVSKFALSAAAHLESGLERLAALLYSEKKFTDTSRYVLKCDKCGAVLNGNHEATIHVNKTGHKDFSEML